MSGWAPRIRGLLVGATVSVLAAPGLAQESPALQGLLARHRCGVVERLKVLHATSAPADRFLIVSVRGDAQAYVQCLFLPDKPNVLCEASSGHYRGKDGEPQVWTLHPDRQARLQRLGFGTDASRGNFQRMLDLAADPDFEQIADLMLSGLHHGYGADHDTPVRMAAPLVPQSSDIDRSCRQRARKR